MRANILSIYQNCDIIPLDAALVFLYKNVLKIELKQIREVVRAPQRRNVRVDAAGDDHVMHKLSMASWLVPLASEVWGRV